MLEKLWAIFLKNWNGHQCLQDDEDVCLWPQWIRRVNIQNLVSVWKV